jgi:urate oxidase
VAPRLEHDSYGKHEIRLVTVHRHGTRHELRDLTLSVMLEGDFAAAHVSGDNAALLPTDTMKNIVYALAQKHAAVSLEHFGAAIGERLLAEASAASRAVVEIAQHEWHRVASGERGHDHAFVRGTTQRRLAWASVTRAGVTFDAGLSGLGILKTAGSAFSGFPPGEYTTLRETRDRILATQVEARWRYLRAPQSFDLAWRSVRGALIETFADHDSESVQHTLFAMGSAALERCEEVVEIRLTMPNKHHVPVDLSPFGLENRNEVFVATEAPYGVIQATVAR